MNNVFTELDTYFTELVKTLHVNLNNFLNVMAACGSYMSMYFLSVVALLIKDSLLI